MTVGNVWPLVLQPDAEKDQGFREEVSRRSRNGLRFLGWTMAVVPLAMCTALVPFSAIPSPVEVWVLSSILVLVGAAALLVERLPAIRRHARLAGLIVCFVAAAIIIWTTVFRAAEEASLIYLVNAQVAMVILIGLLTLPLKPVHVLLLGLSIEAFYCVSYHLAAHWNLLATTASANVNTVFLIMVTLMSTAVSVNVYRQMRETYLSHQEELRATNELQEAQRRVLLSDSAASMGRLAAALSHELNNPLGALKSSIDTIARLERDRSEMTAEKRAAAGEIEAKLWGTARSSVERIQGTVKRIQRFTNLDRAEILAVDINSLLTDVAEIVGEAMQGKVQFDLDLKRLPAIKARPQQLSAVFSALLHSAGQATGDGGSSVQVATRCLNSEVEVTIHDHGKELPPGELALAFSPAFRVREGRMVAANWNLFGSREMIRHHGGDIVIGNAPGQGTTVLVTLPC